jgi:hypothetical protein
MVTPSSWWLDSAGVSPALDIRERGRAMRWNKKDQARHRVQALSSYESLISRDMFTIEKHMSALYEMTKSWCGDCHYKDEIKAAQEAAQSLYNAMSAERKGVSNKINEALDELQGKKPKAEAEVAA